MSGFILKQFSKLQFSPLFGGGVLLFGLLLSVSGCANPILQGKLSDAGQEQARLAAQLQEVTLRAEAANKQNELLQKHSAQFQMTAEQSRVETQKLNDQVVQLTAENGRLKSEITEKDNNYKTYQTSMQSKAAVSITPNSSFKKQLLNFNIPGVTSREDGDYLRVEFPDSFLLKSGTWEITTDAEQALRQVINELRLNYPDQEIAVEGHTDDLVASSQNLIYAQEVGMQKALVVYHFLTNNAQINPKQLFVISYGANRPAVANTSEEGRSRNRRVELVVCPQRWNR